MTGFEIYQSKQNALHYVAIAEGDTGETANRVRNSKNLQFLVLVPDDGKPRIAFDPKEAMSRIEKNGFYAFNVTISIRESADG